MINVELHWTIIITNQLTIVCNIQFIDMLNLNILDRNQFHSSPVMRELYIV
jgi:hypothetical protein